MDRKGALFLTVVTIWAQIALANNFRIVDDVLKMPDGVPLAVTYYLPEGAGSKKKYPVLFELLPYRKDDFFKDRDYALYHYFVNRGFAIAKVDVRGTGGSAGALPNREYSERELSDAEAVIKQLTKKPWSDGNVIMWGISWSGFNALQVAMRKPQGLKAILAAHATDDLYHDDVHFIDGIFHVDEYHLSILHDNGFLKSPDYKIDKKYFRDRFDIKPWIFQYLRNQNDGPFWSKNSLRNQYDKIEIPIFMIGGLLDGYRDSIPRMMENMQTPIHAVLGPWNHAWPDNGSPSPQLEWRPQFISWLQGVLRKDPTPQKNSPSLLLFVRDAHLPSDQLEITSGAWRRETWPITRTQPKNYYLSAGNSLNPTPLAADSRSASPPNTVSIHYKPSAGVELGSWWGEPTADMRPLDRDSIVFDSPVLSENFEMIGRPRLHSRVSSSQSRNHWVARLEDVHPTGEVSLVTAAALNGAQRESRLHPKPFLPEQWVDLQLDLHFSTWTFKPGHKLRLAVTNGAFPMLWPLPQITQGKIAMNDSGSFISVPTVSPSENIHFAEVPEPRPSHPAISEDDSAAWPGKTVIHRTQDGETSVENSGNVIFRFPGLKIESKEKTVYTTNDHEPAQSSFFGSAEYNMQFPKRKIRYQTQMKIRSDELFFHVTFQRKIWQNNRLLRTKLWRESVRREDGLDLPLRLPPLLAKRDVASRANIKKRQRSR